MESLNLPAINSGVSMNKKAASYLPYSRSWPFLYFSVYDNSGMSLRGLTPVFFLILSGMLSIRYGNVVLRARGSLYFAAFIILLTAVTARFPLLFRSSASKCITRLVLEVSRTRTRISSSSIVIGRKYVVVISRVPAECP